MITQVKKKKLTRIISEKNYLKPVLFWIVNKFDKKGSDLFFSLLIELWNFIKKMKKEKKRNKKAHSIIR